MRVGAFRAATDGAGVATIDVPAGTYEVSARKAGYEAAVTRVEVPAAPTSPRACRRCRTEGMFREQIATWRRREARRRRPNRRETAAVRQGGRNFVRRLGVTSGSPLGLVAVNGNLHPDGEGILCHAEPHQLIRTAALDHPADYLAVRALSHRGETTNGG